MACPRRCSSPARTCVSGCGIARRSSSRCVVPLVLASIFGLIFHNAIGGKVTFTFGLVDQDRGVVARIFETAAPAAARAPGAREDPLRADTVRRTGLRRTATVSSATFVLPAGLSAAVAVRSAGVDPRPRQRRCADRRAGCRVDRDIVCDAHRRPAHREPRRGPRVGGGTSGADRDRRRLDGEPPARRRHVLRGRDGRVLRVLHRPVRDLEHPRRAPRRHARADHGRADPSRFGARRQAAHEPDPRLREHGRARGRDALPPLGARGATRSASVC